jgi:hypothetical protein
MTDALMLQIHHCLYSSHDVVRLNLILLLVLYLCKKWGTCCLLQLFFANFNVVLEGAIEVTMEVFGEVRKLGVVVLVKDVDSFLWPNFVGHSFLETLFCLLPYSFWSLNSFSNTSNHIFFKDSFD